MDLDSILYSLAGLGLMFFGIKQFSQSLQSITGPFIRLLVNKRTDNLFRVSGIGFTVALFTQGSMGFSYMVLAYVNAGLLNFAQSLHMLLGAQLGFTLAAWFFSVSFGSLTTFLLLFLGFIPSLFGQRYFVSQMSKCFFGIGLVLLGMDFLDRIHISLIPYLGAFTGIQATEPGFYQSFLLVVLAVILLTGISRSKLLVVAISYSLMNSFPFSPYFSIAIVLGMAIGAAIPQMFISSKMSSSTRRTAFGYFCIETIITIILVISMESLVPHIIGDYDWSGGVGFALIYSSYTLLSLVSYFLFGKLFFEKIINSLVPEASYKEAKKLQLRGNLGDISTALAIDLVEQELKKMSAMVEIQLDLSRSNLVSRMEDKAIERKVSKYEKITDNIDTEIVSLIKQLMQRSLQEDEVIELRSFLQVSDDLESIADAAEELLTHAKRIRKDEESLPAELTKSMRGIGNYLQEYYIQIFTSMMDNTEIPESHERFHEKIVFELKDLKRNQKKLAADSIISSDANQNLFEIQNCFSRVLRYSKSLSDSLSERYSFLKENP